MLSQGGGESRRLAEAVMHGDVLTVLVVNVVRAVCQSGLHLEVMKTMHNKFKDEWIPVHITRTDYEYL